MAELIIVPRWSGTGRSDFYPWLIARAASELALPATVIELRPTPEASELALPATVIELRPTPDAPQPRPSAEAVTNALATATRPIVLAHSVGCRAALIAAAALPERQPLEALICIAGWFSVDAPWATLLPWLADDLFDASRLRTRVRHLAVVLSDDDPYTRDHVATRARFEDLGATVTVAAGRQHFNRAEEPAAWQALELARARAGLR